MIVHYVDFDTPGALFPETETRKVSSRIPAELQNIPNNTYAISYSSREEITKNGKKLVGDYTNESVRILFGNIYTLKMLKEAGFDEHSILYRNVSNSGVKGKVIKCITGNWQPLMKKDIILPDYEALKGLVDPI